MDGWMDGRAKLAAEGGQASDDRGRHGRQRRRESACVCVCMCVYVCIYVCTYT